MRLPKPFSPGQFFGEPNVGLCWTWAVCKVRVQSKKMHRHPALVMLQICCQDKVRAAQTILSYPLFVGGLGGILTG